MLVVLGCARVRVAVAARAVLEPFLAPDGGAAVQVLGLLLEPAAPVQVRG